MGDEVRWLHGQPRVAEMLQQEQGQGVAGMLHENQGWVKRPQGQPQARKKREQMATEPQEMRAVAQPLEAKVHGAAKLHPWPTQPP